MERFEGILIDYEPRIDKKLSFGYLESWVPSIHRVVRRHSDDNTVTELERMEEWRGGECMSVELANRRLKYKLFQLKKGS